MKCCLHLRVLFQGLVCALIFLLGDSCFGFASASFSTNLAGGLQQADERAWRVDVVLEGPLTEADLLVGDGGSSHLKLSLLSGEQRRLSLPVPIRAPLGARTLESLPLPEVRLAVPEGGSVKVEGWSEFQPAAAFENLPPGLALRSRPPAESGGAASGASPGGLLLLLLALVVALFLRRRPWTSLGAGLLLGGAALLLQLGAGQVKQGGIVIEADLERGQWIEVRSAYSELSGPFESLAIDLGEQRAHVPIELHLRLDTEGSAVSPVEGTQRAVAPGLVLVGRRLLEGSPPALGPEKNDWGDFERVFLREPGGSMGFLGPWPKGSAAPLPRPQEPSAKGHPRRSSPPGWLSSGLPSGRWVFLGLLLDGRWVRATGFPGDVKSTESH